MGVGNRIKQARESKGMSRNELANRINVSPSAISNYENEISHPKEDIMYRLLKVLEVDANFLFQDEIEIEKPAPQEDGLSNIVLTDAQKELLNVILRLDGDRLKAVLEYAAYQASLNNQ